MKSITSGFNIGAAKITMVDVALVGAVSVAAVFTAFSLNDFASTEGFYTDGHRGIPLTEGEADLARSIFGDQINTSVVQKHYYPEAHPDAAADADQDTQDINFYGPEYYEADYSQDAEGFNYGTYVHEMTHIAQFQGLSQTTSCKQYQYSLSPELHFNDYCNEQQASIVEDYVRRFLHPSHQHSYRYISSRGFATDDTPESDALLQKVVEDQFPRARETRLALEAKAQAPAQTAQSKAYWRSDLELVIKM